MYMFCLYCDFIVEKFNNTIIFIIKKYLVNKAVLNKILMCIQKQIHRVRANSNKKRLLF